MCLKFTFGLLFLWVSTIALAQESDSVIYDRSLKPSGIEKKKSTYAAKEGRLWVVKNRKAKLTYAEKYLILSSSQGEDTVFLSGITKIKRKLSGGKCLSIHYNNSNYLDITFPVESQAKIAKRFIKDSRVYSFDHKTDSPMWAIILEAVGWGLLSWTW